MTDDAAAAPTRHLGPVIALGLAAAVAVAVIVVALVGGDDVSPTALTVDGTRATSAQIDGELDGFSGSEYFADLYTQGGRAFSVSDGSIAALGTAQWLSFRTQTQLAEAILDQEGASLTGDQVDTVARALRQQGITAGMSGGAATRLARFSASAEALVEQLGSYDDYRAAMRRAARRASVDVDAKYGVWDQSSLAFCVPAGCEQGGLSVVPQAQSEQPAG